MTDILQNIAIICISLSIILLTKEKNKKMTAIISTIAYIGFAIAVGKFLKYKNQNND